jgi:hypothetical protein
MNVECLSTTPISPSEKGIAESQALESGMQEKRNEFVKTGAELYTKL